jgi:hypothetical protein
MKNGKWKMENEQTEMKSADGKEKDDRRRPRPRYEGPDRA